jgi:hypothetical protein
MTTIALTTRDLGRSPCYGAPQGRDMRYSPQPNLPSRDASPSLHTVLSLCWWVAQGEQ